MKKLIVIFNHILTERQREDSRDSLKVEKIILPPDNLRNIWKRVPSDLENLDGYLQPIAAWLKETAEVSDYVLIQGEFGTTFYLVSLALKQGLQPVYSTTDREAIEEHMPGGEVEVKHRFRHVRFRKYRGLMP